MISAPEDYGLSAEQTLAHSIAVDPPADFGGFWAEFREEVDTLPRHWQGSLEPGANRVVISSLREVRVVARVTMPDDAPIGVVITTHGSEAPDDFPEAPEPWTSRGLATVRLRVRGYPPSTMDIEDHRGNWIMQGIESPEAWIVRGAVADVMQAFRGARAAFGADVPIGLHGESLGGGLAVIAAAQLHATGTPPFRMAIALPTFGDWAWREERYCNGAGGQVNFVLDLHRDQQREHVRHTLQLFDAAHHARAIECPVLCKLATLDDTVPAPSSAAILNAIASRRTWVFQTRYGHYDGGLTDLRRHALFERLHPAMLDPRQEPEDAIAAAGVPLTI